MNSLSAKTGYISALQLLISLAAWIVCFSLIAVGSPLFYWTNLQEYLVYESTYSQIFQNIAKAFMLFFAPLFVVFLASFYDFIAEERKVFARLSLLFALAFAVLSSLHYFIQISAVRQNIASGATAGLEHYLQANPYSLMTAADMTGWSLFLGLSSFFMYMALAGRGSVRILRIFFLCNAIFSFVGGIGYIYRLDSLTFLCINLGVGGALLILGVGSLKFFKKPHFN